MQNNDVNDVLVYRLGTGCDLADVAEGNIYQGKVQGFANFGMFVQLNDRIKGLVHKTAMKGDHKERDSILVRVRQIRPNGNIDLEEVTVQVYQVQNVERKSTTVRISELSTKVGKTVAIEGEIAQIKQTSGPTIFTIVDETGTQNAAAFIEAGVRAYPEAELTDIVRVIGEVMMRNNQLQIEADMLTVLSEDEASGVQARIEKALDLRSEPEDIPLLVKSDVLERLRPEMKKVAKIIRKAVFTSQPIILRHHADAERRQLQRQALRQAHHPGLAGGVMRGVGTRLPGLAENALMKATQARLLEVARQVQPHILHAHSPVLNAIPVLRVGRELGIPVVYEVRAFWEDAAVDHGTTAEGSLRYRMTQQLETLALARAEHQATDPARFELVELNALARSVVQESVPDAISRRVDLGFEPAEQPVRIVGVPLLLRELMLNLVDNGLRYVPEGGSVTLRIRRDGEAAFIDVEDTGIGIAKENLGQVMTEFFREKRSETRSIEGSGLGLAIVKEIVEAHGGKIGVRSQVGHGTKFTIHLPLTK